MVRVIIKNKYKIVRDSYNILSFLEAIKASTASQNITFWSKLIRSKKFVVLVKAHKLIYISTYDSR